MGDSAAIRHSRRGAAQHYATVVLAPAGHEYDLWQAWSQLSPGGRHWHAFCEGRWTENLPGRRLCWWMPMSVRR